MSSMEPHELPGNIFMQPWWLDVVASGHWKDIRVEKGGQIFARWPIVQKKEKGFTFITMPVLTQKLGPWIKQNAGKQESLHRNERSMLQELISQLPKFDKFGYNLSEDIINYLPFIWTGFTQHSLTTFRFVFPFEHEKVFKQLKSSVRRHIKRAAESLEIDSNLNIEELYEMISLTFERQSKEVPYSKQILFELCEKALEKNRATILGAKDSSGKLHAAHMFIHDDEVTYYLAGGFDPDSEINGAVSFVLWNGIKEAEKRNNCFDFEGSSIESIEYYFSSFGAKPIHFHNIRGVSKRFAPIYYSKKLINRLKE